VRRRRVRSDERAARPEVPLFTLALIGLVGGLITGISPCILPVLPVIFLSGGAQSARGTSAAPARGASATRATGPVPKQAGRRPYLVVAGLALSFSIFTLVGTVLLSALHLPQEVIRGAGLIVLVLLGVGMIIPRVEALLERPFSRIPQRSVDTDRGGFVLGLALGAVYVPCAGPVLAAITVAGATGRIGAETVVLTVSFAVGTAIPLLIFALAGRRVAERVRAFRTHQRALRVGAGVVVIGLAVALTFNVTDAIQRAVPDYTTALNNAADTTGKVTKALAAGPRTSLAACVQKAEQEQPTTALENCGPAPAVSGIQQWLNTPNDAALSLKELKGKVVLIDFWAYSCINCQRAIAHVTAWDAAYRGAGLEVIGVHTPEYAFEHVADNVAAGARRLHITYPVALDNDYATWNNFGNNAWPADYLIDANGVVRKVEIGEGNYPGTESLIRTLLTAANRSVALPPATDVADTTPTSAITPETYLDPGRASNYAGHPALAPGTSAFTYPPSVPPDEFALAGTWTVGQESLTAKKNAAIKLNYLAAHIYLDVGGTGTVTATVGGRTRTYHVSGAPNIYPLLDLKTAKSGTLLVTLAPGLSAYSFTFG
jgi:cytochrome c biogenesis protein CcdA/thiol-disulfide isomerase/thioredoxin